MSTTYPFGLQFQTNILSLILRDPAFALDFRDALRPEYFEDPHFSTICKVTLDYIDKKGKPPSLPVLHVELGRYAKRFLDEDEYGELKTKSSSCYNKPPADEEYVRERALEFAQHQSLKSSVLEAAATIRDIEKGRSGSYDQVRDVLNRGMQVGMNGVRDLGFGISKEVKYIPKLVKESYLKGHTIPTGVPTLDGFMHGGLGRGEVGIIFGPPKRGKSTILVNFGAKAAQQGFAVVHYTFELKKVDVILKYASRATGFVPERIKRMKRTDIGEFHKRMTRWYSGGPEIGPWIIYERPGTVTVDWVRSHLSRLKTVHDVNPDLVIIDYMDRMSKKGEDLYTAGGTAMEKLVAIGDDFNCSIWTASQVGRQGKSNEREHGFVSDTDIAESWRKIADCDIAISLNQTVDEKLQTPAPIRLFITDQRRGEDCRWIHCTLDYARARLVEKPKAEKEVDDAPDALSEFLEDEED